MSAATLPEPDCGAVVRVTTPRSKYPEIWVSSYVNQGCWYPDTDSWLGGSARHDHPGGCEWDDLTRRGAVTLLTAGNAEAYAAGWRAACEAMSAAAHDIADDAPEVA